MSRLIHVLLKSIIGFAVAGVVLLALLVGIARTIVYEADSFQADIAYWLQARTGVQLQFSKLTGSWQGLAPRFEFSDVEIQAQEDQPSMFFAEHVDLEILLLASLINMQPRVRLTIDGARLSAHYSDGYLQLDGLAKSQRANHSDSIRSRYWFEVLMSQPWISFSNSQVKVTGLYPEAVQFSLRNFQFQSYAQWRYLNGQLDAEGPSSLKLNVRGRVKGTLFKANSLNGLLYFKADPADWQPWLPTRYKTLAQAEIEALSGGGEFWLNFNSGVVREVVSRFDLNRFVLSSENKIKPPKISRLSGSLHWQGRWGADWRLAIDNMQMKTDAFLWQPSVLNLSANKLDGQRVRYIANLDEMDITPWLNYFLGTQSSQSNWHQTLSDLRPEGQVKNLYLDFEFSGQQLLDYRFAVELYNLHNRPLGFIPGVHDLDLKAWGGQNRIYFAVDETNLELNYPRLFRDQLIISQLQGGVRLALKDNGVYLQSNAIQAATQDVRGVTQFSLFLPADKSQSPFLRLQSTLRDADGSTTSKYLPAGVIDKATLTWLDQAILGGELIRGDIIVHGATRQASIEPLGVLLGFSATNAQLRFDPHWREPIQQGKADVVVDRGEVSAHVLEAEYFAQELQRGYVFMPRFEPGKPHTIRIEAETKGAAQSGFEVLKRTPLLDMLGEFILDVEATQGELDVGLTLDIPLPPTETEKVRANADISLVRGAVNWASQNIQLQALDGRFNFSTEHGFSASSLQGQTLGGEFNGKIITNRAPQSIEHVVVSARGDADLAEVKSWRPLAILDPVRGRANYSLELAIPLPDDSTVNPPIVLAVNSALEGVTIEAPLPFNKPPKRKVPFKLRLAMHTDNQEVEVFYGDQVKGIFQLSDTGLERGAINIGGGNAKLPERNRLTIAGTLPELNYDEWFDYFEQQPPNLEPKVAGEPATDVADKDSGWKDWLLKIDDSAFRISNVIYDGHAWGSADFSIYHKLDRWRVGVDNQQISGVVEIPFSMLSPELAPQNAQVPLRIELTRLHLPEGKQDEAAPPSNNFLSPIGLPPMSVQIDSLKNGTIDLGKWLVEMTPLPQGMRIGSVNSQIGESWLTGEGLWLKESNQAVSTEVDLVISGADLGAALKSFTGEPLLSSETTRGTANLDWPGAPFDFSLSRAAGEMSIRLENGKLYETNANAAGKLWGALNFETLLRRLQLNFDDLSESEMVYDSIDGDFKLYKNQLDVDKLSFEMPAIKINVDGTLDLSSSTLAMDLALTVPVTRNLVLPAAVIGGLPAAATAFVVEKLLGEQFDKLTTFKYDISGPIKEPNVKLKSEVRPQTSVESVTP